MSVSPKSLANLQPLAKGFDPRRNLSGRPKNWVSTLTTKGYKKTEIVSAINVLMALRKFELEEIGNNPESTALERIIALALLQSIKKKSIYNIETLLTRVYGAPKQEVENTLNITAFKVRFNEGEPKIEDADHEELNNNEESNDGNHVP